MLSKKSVKLTILVSEIIYMVLELCISYLFSPYFGSSNNVWTGIIGVILLSGSVGNYVGGKLAEKKDKDFVPFLFLLTSIFIFLIGILSDYVCITLSNAISNNSLASLLSSFVLLFPSSFCLGTLPPQLMTKEVCKDQKEIGKVYMISTIGGLLGTFVGGYVLIPSMGVNLIVFLCGFISFLFGIGNLTKYWRPTLLSVMFDGFYLFLILSSSNRSQVYEDTLVFDSIYNRIVVMDTEDENGSSKMVPSGFHNYGNTRVWGFYMNKDRAIEAIKENMLDINEGVYDYACLEAYEEGITHPLTNETMWFQFDKTLGVYVEIDTPELEKKICCRAIG